jgi:hypothetical protein
MKNLMARRGFCEPLLSGRTNFTGVQWADFGAEFQAAPLESSIDCIDKRSLQLLIPA